MLFCESVKVQTKTIDVLNIQKIIIINVNYENQTLVNVDNKH